MPITPAHLGPIVLIGALSGRKLNIVVMITSAILIDLEHLYLWIKFGDITFHGYFHTFGGATLYGIALGILYFLLLHVYWRFEYHKYGHLESYPELRDSQKRNWTNSFKCIIMSALIGVYAHISLDWLIYDNIGILAVLDSNAFYQFSSNYYYGALIVNYIFCIITAILGLFIYYYRTIKKKDRKYEVSSIYEIKLKLTNFKTKKSFWDKYFGWLTGSTGTIFRINHEFDRVARNRIIGVFDQAPIEVNLHIDDGRDHWNGIGEGGDEVRYNESIHAYEYNDFKNINWYREGVFRYALMVDKVYDDDRKQSVRGITSTGKRLIYVSSPLDEANEVAHVFLHELGHLLALNADYLFKPEKASLARKYVKEKKPEKYLDYAIGPDEGYYSCMSYNPKADGILDYSNTGLKTDRIGVYRCDPFYIGDENEMNDLEKNGMFYEDTNAYSKNRPGLLINDWQNMVFGYGVMRFGHYWGV